ncbi:hypothetical protein VKT23_010809 [Stygiomarasmius scandens]|uniref:Uncharacterized protein n=1 Tax=Marasmiellus scandens TaxID=2682957 RepID=A0ABR1JEC9_9AGAR
MGKKAVKQKRRKGEAHEWTTPEQFKWLTARIPEFKAACRKRKYKSDYQPRLFNEWFIEFPEPGAPGPDASKAERDAYGQKVIVRQWQIHNWFYNHTRPAPDQDCDIASLLLVPENNKKSKSKSSRKKTQEEVFSKTFYATDIKPEVDAELERMRSHTTDGKLPKGASLPIVKRITHEKFLAATEDVKQQVALLTEDHNKSETEEKSMTVDEENRKKFIAQLPEICPRIVEALHTATGWPVTLILGGEDENREIKTKGYHAGKNLLGLSFKKAYPSYKTNVLDPFALFVHSCYHYGNTSTPTTPTKTSSTDSLTEKGSADSTQTGTQTRSTFRERRDSLTLDTEPASSTPALPDPNPASSLHLYQASDSPDPALFPQTSDEVTEMLHRLNSPSLSIPFFPTNTFSYDDPLNMGPYGSFPNFTGAVPSPTIPLAHPQPAVEATAGKKRKQTTTMSDQNVDPTHALTTGSDPGTRKRRKHDTLGEDTGIDVNAPRGRRNLKAPSRVPNCVNVTQQAEVPKKGKGKGRK